MAPRLFASILLLLLLSPGLISITIAAQTPPAKAPAQAPSAQAPPPAKPPAQAPATQTPPPQTPAPKPRAARPQPRRATATNARPSLDIEVTDPQGNPIPGVRVTMTGGIDRYGTTGSDGSLKVTGLRTGPYRLRFEADHFTTLERELTLPVANDRLDVTLTPSPAQAPAPEAPRTEPPRPKGEARAVAVPSFAQENAIGRGQPQKLDVVGCTGYATTRVLQIRDPIENRQNPEADETLYVVQGSIVLHVGGGDRGMDAGGLAVLPRGTANSISRRGRDVAVVVSVLSGPACPDAK